MTVTICKSKKKHYFIIPEKFNDVELAVLQEEGLLTDYEKVVFVQGSEDSEYTPMSYLHLYKKEEVINGFPVDSYDITRPDEPYAVFDKVGGRPGFVYAGLDKINNEFITLSQTVYVPEDKTYTDEEFDDLMDKIKSNESNGVNIHLDINKLIDLEDAYTTKAVLELLMKLHKKMEQNKVEAQKELLESASRSVNYQEIDFGKISCDSSNIMTNDVK